MYQLHYFCYLFMQNNESSTRYIYIGSNTRYTEYMLDHQSSENRTEKQHDQARDIVHVQLNKHIWSIYRHVYMPRSLATGPL